MAGLSRRGFIGAIAATGVIRGAGLSVDKPATRRILTLVYDKSLGMMRALERVVAR